MDNLSTANLIPSSISSKDRNLRLIWNFSNQKEWAGLSWLRTEAKLQSTFDAGALVPQEVIDPTTDETYTTWVQYVYNLDNGSFKLRNFDTYTDIRFNLADLSVFNKPMCADLVEQSKTHQRPVWKECSS